ncbi:MAG: hypothetical protein QHG99_07400 [Methanomicrobiales archaeon]|nr:hypothetical protein [Methanomicrobiales archaeon]
MLAELRQGIREGTLDPPIVPLLEVFARLNCCYTIQSCWGHFVHDMQPETKNLASLKEYAGKVQHVLYRIAYLALCIEKSDEGLVLYRDLQGIASRDPEHIQFGSSEFFWKMVPNTYVIQVAPEWGIEEDSLWMGMEEALSIEEVRGRFFEELQALVYSHGKSGG